MKVLAYDAFPNPDSGLDYVALDRLLAESDVVSLHCPLMPETRHMVNAEIDRAVVEGLVERGIRVLAMRCAGYNNVDFKAAYEKGLTVVRVPAYSPYAIAEHAAALLLALNRHIHRAAARTRDFNFSLAGLTGFDLHGKTAGVVGTCRIGRIFADIC